MDEKKISVYGKKEKARYDSRDDNESNEGSIGQVIDSDVRKALLKAVDREFINDLGDEISDGDRVLDYAGGYGNGSRKLHNTHPDIDIETVVIDISRRELEVGRDMEGGEEKSWCVGDGHRLPFKKDQFDAVIARSAFHHLPAWHQHGLDEIRRVLKSNGILGFKDPLRYNPLAWTFRRFFETRDKTEAEVPLNPILLEDRIGRTFEEVSLNGHYLVSPAVGICDKYVPFDMTDPVMSLYDAERWLISRGGFMFAGVVTGIARNPRSSVTP